MLAVLSLSSRGGVETRWQRIAITTMCWLLGPSHIKRPMGCPVTRIYGVLGVRHPCALPFPTLWRPVNRGRLGKSDRHSSATRRCASRANEVTATQFDIRSASQPVWWTRTQSGRARQRQRNQLRRSPSRQLTTKTNLPDGTHSEPNLEQHGCLTQRTAPVASEHVVQHLEGQIVLTLEGEQIVVCGGREWRGRGPNSGLQTERETTRCARQKR